VAGALLARALAEHHAKDGSPDAFGVVTPYRMQVEATEAALEDSRRAHAVPVGTSHAFQGRQFETVLADLVEDGHGRLMTAGLNTGSYNFESVQLFNVAATRSRHRLYVLVSAGALARSRSGPLLVLREMVDQGDAHLLNISSLLGLSQLESPAAGSAEAELLAALEPFVRIAGVHDEEAAIDEVVARIGAATQSVWCWSAWVGRRSLAVQDALIEAHERGLAVRVVARPADQVNLSNQRSLRRLADRVPDVVFMRDMHQKIVVIDEQWSIVGSMNLLSAGPTSSTRLRDVMFTMDGARFAERLLAHEMASELGARRVCPACHAELRECRLSGHGQDRGWVWICPAGHDKPEHRLLFPPGQTRHRAA
jgi:hypothetical protein